MKTNTARRRIVRTSKKTARRSVGRTSKKTARRRNRSKRTRKRKGSKKRRNGGFVRDGSVQQFITCNGRISKK